MPASRTSRDLSGIVRRQSRRSLALLRRRGKFTPSTRSCRSFSKLHFMRVASCQVPDIRDDVSLATDTIREFGLRAQVAGADLICFPECFLQGYFTDVESVERVAIDTESPNFYAWLAELASFRLTLVVGLIERSANEFFNTAVVIKNGALICKYRKIHLLDGERHVFSAGSRPCLFTVRSITVGVSICYDLNFTSSFDGNVSAGARLVVCPCNNMMRRATAEKLKHEHTDIRRAQAEKFGLWLLSSDVTGERGDRVSYGPTSLIRPDGSVVDQVPLMEEGMVVSDVE
jgi:predicted amidohydrolase